MFKLFIFSTFFIIIIVILIIISFIIAIIITSSSLVLRNYAIRRNRFIGLTRIFSLQYLFLLFRNIRTLIFIIFIITIQGLSQICLVALLEFKIMFLFASFTKFTLVFGDPKKTFIFRNDRSNDMQIITLFLKFTSSFLEISTNPLLSSLNLIHCIIDLFLKLISRRLSLFFNFIIICLVIIIILILISKLYTIICCIAIVIRFNSTNEKLLWVAYLLVHFVCFQLRHYYGVFQKEFWNRSFSRIL